MSDLYTQHTLDNGLRIVIETMPDVRSAAVGFLVLAGARNEVPQLAGVSHFLEHMMFKGTAKRSWQDITIDFDRMGSTYNAYTSEDRTMYYGWVREKDIARQMELLADMLRPKLPPDEFDTEKKVVLEEIAMGKDSLEHVALDFLQEKVFAGNSLAWPVLGYEETVSQLTRDQMHEYFQQRYAADNVLLVVAGNVEPSEIIDTAQELCGDWQRSTGLQAPETPRLRTGVDVLTSDRFKQQLVALTYPSVATADDLAESASALGTILGGENSRFYWNIEQQGISPSVGAFHLDYSDCGAMILYGTCPPENTERLVTAMRTEVKRISSERVQDHEVDRVKNRRRTSLAIESEAPYHRLSQLMDDMQYRGGPRTVEQMLAEVDAVTPDSIRTYLERYPMDTAEHLTSVGPRQWPEKS